jgi:RNA polymerase sigma factor (sigma-70 family)
MEDDQLSDEFLIEAIAGEAMWALERLYRRYRGRFYAMAYRMTSDHMVAEELVQDAFFAIWQNSGSYDPATGKVSTWLFSIIYHATVNYLRDVRRRSALQQVTWLEVEADERCVLPDVWDQIWRTVQNAEIRASVSKLALERRLPIELAFFWGWTHSEIALHCQLPLGTVKARIRLGLQQLKQELEQRAAGQAISSSNKRKGKMKSKPVATTVVIQAKESICTAENICASGYELYGDGPRRCFGYTEWLALVEQVAVFEFHGTSGSFTARKERRLHGRTYWYAYTSGSTAGRKTYLGKSAELTLARLEAMAKKLYMTR